jgi:signal transduction histidine kinase
VVSDTAWKRTDDVRRRIVVLAILAAVLATTLFGVPLAIGVAKYNLDDERSELERLADSVALTLSATYARGATPKAVPEAERGTSVALYDADGTRRLGGGPDQLDVPLPDADDDALVSPHDTRELVVVVPVSDGTRVLGVVRAATPSTEVWLRTLLTWLGMALLGTVAVGVTWTLARRQARKLAAPLDSLSAAAVRLGGGDFTVRTDRSGIGEIDSVGHSMDTTAQRLGELLARERAFSADASHQLRTPLAGLRLQLEAALESPGADLRKAITAGIATTDRLERTIDDLLALARDTQPHGGVVAVRDLLAEVETDWHGLLAEQGRVLRIDVGPDVADHQVSAPVLGQIMTVLLDNALRHGHGVVQVTAREVANAVAVDVTDEGSGITSDLDPFRPRTATSGASGHGIGLALARRLAEGEGGRLRLARPSPPTFTLLLPTRE